MISIGKLVEVDVRELWGHEQYDFSNWMAKADNLEYLNDILGLTLIDVNKEVYVGSYRCDLVAKDETSDITVIVENQLEATNHDHLGKIITYASGLGAQVIVWIAKEAKEEHRAAIEWLNNNTGSDLNFFLIEIHACKIGDSAVAPRFEVVEKPNGFVKRNRKLTPEGNGLNKSKSERLIFWERFNEIVAEQGKPFNTRKVTTDHYYNIAVGSKEANICIDLVNKDGIIVVELYINNSKDLFDQLYTYKADIEEELGINLIWDRLDKKKASRIKYYIPGLDFNDHTNYDDLIQEIIDVVVKMRKTFKKYL